MVKKTRLGILASKLVPWRTWIQASFLLVWLDPMGFRLHTMCAPVFHCYACPLSTFACPIGIIAQFSALHILPFIAIGLLVTFGALFGSLVCGWACPFGFLQDLAVKVPTPRFDLPKAAGYVRYVMLIGTVLLIPYFFGEEHPLFVCRICPAGALEAAVPNMAGQFAAGKDVVWPNAVKLTILALFLGAIFFVKRPWCRVLCPLGAIFSLFNRFSALFIRFEADECTQCERCHKLCKFGIEPEKSANDLRCVRCLECTKCRPEALTLGSIFEKKGTAENQHSK
ncbi:MAG: 4Fe-4S binding protein [Planctomycetota bacterium]